MSTSRELRIATITSGPPDGTGGTDRHLRSLTDLLLEDGHKVEDYHFEQLNPPRPWTLLDRLGFRLPGNSRLLAERVLAQPPYDLIFVNSLLGSHLPKGPTPVVNMFHSVDIAYAEAVREGVRYLDYLRQRFVWSYFEKRSARRHRAVAISGRIRRELRQYYDVEAEVIPYCYDEQIFHPGSKAVARERLGLPQNGYLALYAGTWGFRKGCDILNHLVGYLPGDFKLVAAVSYVEPGFTLDPRISLLGRIPAQEMGWVYRACDFLVFPTRAEACPFATKEAMACGIPVVTTTAGTGEDLKKDPDLGRWVIDCPPRADDFCDIALKMVSEIRDGNGTLIGEQFLRYAQASWSVAKFKQNFRALISDYQ